MKKFAVLVFLSLSLSLAHAQTAEDVINKFIQASGGKEKMNAITTLQYLQTLSVKTPFGNMDIPMQFSRERGKLFRLSAKLDMMGQPISFFTLVTDTAGYIMMPAMPMMGMNGGLQKMTTDELQAQQGQMDPGTMFGPLVNYAGYGASPTLLGTVKVNNADCYKLQLATSGDTVLYFIDKATNLVSKTTTSASASANMSGLGSLFGGMPGGAAKSDVSVTFSGYTVVNGVSYPTKTTMQNPMGETTSLITNFRVNEPIDAALYKPE